MLRNWNSAAICGLRRLTALADLVDPAAENVVERAFDVDELDADADARLQNAHDGECFDGLRFSSHDSANPGADRKRLAGAHEAATERQIGSDAAGAGAGFHVDDLDIGCKGKADGVASVSDASFT